jgi:hypothetical protein
MGRDRRSGGCDGRLLLHAAACRIGDSADCHCRTRGCALAIQRRSSPRRAAARARVRACTRAAATRGGANCCPATAADTCAHARIDAANRSGARTGNRSRRGSRERTGIARCSAAAAAIASPIGAARQRRVAPRRRRRDRSALKSGSAPAGWFGSAALHLPSAASFWCVTRSSRD